MQFELESKSSVVVAMEPTSVEKNVKLKVLGSHDKVVVQGFAHFESSIISEVQHVAAHWLTPVLPPVGCDLGQVLLAKVVDEPPGGLSDAIGMETWVNGGRVSKI